MKQVSVSILNEIILLIIAGFIGFFSYMGYQVACSNSEKIDIISSDVVNINDTLNQWELID